MTYTTTICSCQKDRSSSIGCQTVDGVDTAKPSPFVVGQKDIYEDAVKQLYYNCEGMANKFTKSVPYVWRGTTLCWWKIKLLELSTPTQTSCDLTRSSVCNQTDYPTLPLQTRPHRDITSIRYHTQK